MSIPDPAQPPQAESEGGGGKQVHEPADSRQGGRHDRVGGRGGTRAGVPREETLPPGVQREIVGDRGVFGEGFVRASMTTEQSSTLINVTKEVQNLEAI